MWRVFIHSFVPWSRHHGVVTYINISYHHHHTYFEYLYLIYCCVVVCPMCKSETMLEVYELVPKYCCSMVWESTGHRRRWINIITVCKKKGEGCWSFYLRHSMLLLLYSVCHPLFFFFYYIIIHHCHHPPTVYACMYGPRGLQSTGHSDTHEKQYR